MRGDKLLTTTSVTVTETEEKSFNWLEVLTLLVEGKLNAPYYSGLHLNLSRLARDWPSCACGQLCKQLPRFDGGAPHDTDLNREGVSFSGYVNAADWLSALKSFKKIEERSTYLLRDL